MTNISDLPRELINKIFSMLDVNSLRNLDSTAKVFHGLLSNQEFLTNLYKNRFHKPELKSELKPEILAAPLVVKLLALFGGIPAVTIQEIKAINPADRRNDYYYDVITIEYANNPLFALFKEPPGTLGYTIKNASDPTAIRWSVESAYIDISYEKANALIKITKTPGYHIKGISNFKFNLRDIDLIFNETLALYKAFYSQATKDFLTVMFKDSYYDFAEQLLQINTEVAGIPNHDTDIFELTLLKLLDISSVEKLETCAFTTYCGSHDHGDRGYLGKENFNYVQVYYSGLPQETLKVMQEKLRNKFPDLKVSNDLTKFKYSGIYPNTYGLEIDSKDAIKFLLPAYKVFLQAQNRAENNNTTIMRMVP